MYLGKELYAHFAGVFHFLLQKCADLFLFRLVTLDYQFIVNLHDELCAFRPVGHALRHLYHCNFYNVCRRTLNGHIARNPFAESPKHFVCGGKLGEIAAAVEKGLGKAVLARFFNNLLHIAVNAAVMVKIAFDIGIGFPARYADILCKRECADAVYYAEIYCLCSASHQWSDHMKRHIEHL